MKQINVILHLRMIAVRSHMLYAGADWLCDYFEVQREKENVGVEIDSIKAAFEFQSSCPKSILWF